MKRINLIMLVIVAILTLTSCQKERTCGCINTETENKDSLIIGITGTEEYIQEQIDAHPEWDCKY